MASVTFVLKEPQKDVTPGKQEKTLIYLIFRLPGGKKRLKISTRWKIYPHHWNTVTKRARTKGDYPQATELNQRLDDFEREVEKAYNNLLYQGISPTKEEIKDLVLEKLNIFVKKNEGTEKETLNQYIARFITEIETGKRLTPEKKERYKQGTIKNIKGFQVQFNEFQKNINKQLDFEDITIDVYDLFVGFFNGKKYAPNTIGRHIKNLKAIMRAARDEKLHTNVEIERKKFKTIKVETDQIYLNKDEVDRLYNLDLSDNALLDIARDVFLTGVYTAQRFSDYSRITKDNIRKLRNGQKVIELVQQKTGERITVPVHPNLEVILKKYDYTLPKTYEQKINERIKKVGDKAGIKEKVQIETIKGGLKVSKAYPKNDLIKTHTARRSGATNMYLAGIPTLDIMKLTGHKTEREFLKYIRVSKEETAEMLSNHEYFRPRLKKIS